MSTREQVIREIFDRDLGWFRPSDSQRLEVPTIEHLEEFAELLAEGVAEEKLQKFIARTPQILTGNFGWGDDSIVAFFPKPPVGTKYRADFAVLLYGQGGCYVHLVEIEPSDSQLFNQDLSEAGDLRAAVTQIEDWHQWITANRDTFVRDMIDRTKKLPPYHNREEGGPYRMQESEEIQNLWRSFGGFDDPALRYHIVIGRWAKLSRDEQERLIFLNRQKNALYDITTYDQLARRAFDRPYLRY